MISLISAWHPEERYIERFLEYYRKNKDTFSELVLICNGQPSSNLKNLIYADDNVKLVVIKKKDFSLFWNSAAEKCKEEWILLLAPDEILDGCGLDELKKSNFNKNFIYCFRRKNLFNKRFYKNVFPIEKQERLFHYQDRWKNQIHEVIDSNKERIMLGGMICHDCYNNWSHVFQKSKSYIPLEAKRYGFLKVTLKSFYMILSETKTLPIYIKDGFFGLSWYCYSVLFWLRVLIFRIRKSIWS